MGENMRFYPIALRAMNRYFTLKRTVSPRGRLLGCLRALALLLCAGVPLAAHASVAVLLEMPYGQLGAFNPTGHAALYFDHVCAASPLELRPCRPGELGVVISRYDGIGNVDWVAVPLVPYLYGVESAAEIPSTMDKLTALRMRDLYRREHLQAVAPDTEDGGMPQGNWYQLAGSSFDRSIYGFEVKTSAAQDAQIIAYFNDKPNITQYEGAFRNCADFTRVVMNRLYPHAIRRNYVADFGLTTPKSVARGLVHYARKHPELELSMFRVPQLAGTIPRSMSIQGVTGSLLTRYGVPMAVLAPHVTAVVLVAYIGKGRFAVPKQAPVLDLALLEARLRQGEPSQTGLALRTVAHTDTPEADAAAGYVQEISVTSGDAFPTESLKDAGCAQCETVPYLP